MPREAAPQHIVFYSGVAWRWIRNPSLFLHVFFLYEHTLIILILHPPSGPIGPAGVRGGAYAASFSLHKGITVTRWRVLNLLPSLYDFFSISGRNLPFGAGQSRIWERKVLL